MHFLRHSFASALIMGGAPVGEVQTLLGHASPAITLRIYSHWFKAQDSGAVGKLSALILGSKKVGKSGQAGMHEESRNHEKSLIYKAWRGGRVVEGTGLENRQRRKSLVGSNPTPSAGKIGDNISDNIR
jgi:hypothetical protein